MSGIVDKSYDLERIKARLNKEKEESKSWLLSNNRDSSLLNSFIFRITVGEMSDMITHIERLTDMLTDDMK